LRKWRVAADTDDFSVFGLEKCMVVRTGRLEILDSGRAEIEHVKVYENVFTLEAAQFELAALAAVEFEVGRFVANSDGAGVIG
jgi:hypothetical protein